MGNTIKATMGFILPCSKCGAEVMVGDTAQFMSKGKEMTAYFHPDLVIESIDDLDWDNVMGISNGSGDSFICARHINLIPAPDRGEEQ